MYRAISRFVLLFVALLTAKCLSFSIIPLNSFHKDSSNTLFMGLRRNNKEEKRKRNRAYARQFQLANGVSRKQLVVQMKRQIVARSEEDFTEKLFQFTTDADMPAYSGFDD